MTRADKQSLIDELKAALNADLDTLEWSQRETQEAATHEESRPENDKDTRALEQSYLARGLAERVSQLRGDVSKLAGMRARAFRAEQAVAIGALAVLEAADGGEVCYLLAPAGGGRRLRGGVCVLTPESPLGRALLGKRLDDEVSLPGRGTGRSAILTGIS